MTKQVHQNIELESGTYEIIRKRLETQATDLQNRLQQLNAARKEVFGAIDTSLIANDRINTNNFCVAQDVFSIGDRCIFGYNVHIGLRSGIQLSDVFSIYQFTEHRFQESSLSLIQDEKFDLDFQNLYRYYKEAYFARFTKIGTYLYMVFHLGKQSEDFKAFKWLINGEQLEYVDARSDHEVRFPKQHEFKWERAHRDLQRMGQHPHVSILDRVFVETVGGDLTIKVEDNTDDGLGIYREEVDYADQTLDDAEYLYADLGHLIVLKIRPYQEAFRYFVFNEKMQEVRRVDSLEDSGVLLPDQHGLIFANGYYLQTGDFKVFDPDMRNKQFKRRITSPNGEDFLYVFYNNTKGVYVLLHYNLIEQSVNTPIVCHGYTLFSDGELCYFRAEEEPTKHHMMQIWQTPFISSALLPSEHRDTYLYKVGNKDIVKAMAEIQEIIILVGKEETYGNLYSDLSKKCTTILDAYYWIGHKEAFELNIALQQIQATATSAIEEFEKKKRIQKNTQEEINRVKTKAELLFDQCRRQTFESVDQFVEALASLRTLRGELISLKDLRYTNLSLVEELENQGSELTDTLSQDCVQFLLDEEALAPYLAKIETEGEALAQMQTAKETNTLESKVDQIGEELELLIEIVSNLKIDDATHTTRIIDRISAMYARLNQVKAAVRKKQKSLAGEEAIAEFNAQLKLLDQGIINYLDVSDTVQKCDEYLTKLMVQLEELEGKFAEFDAFVLQITEKREEIYQAFDQRKNHLLEVRNNRTAALQSAAERILNGIRNRVKAIQDQNEINGFFAADLMIDKVRNIVQQLHDLEDSNKADQIQTQLNTLKEEAIRQLRDRQDLFVDGANMIRLGRHQFSVNVQALDLTIVQEKGKMYFHLTGSDFFLEIDHPEFLATRSVWNQQLISENEQVYRAEYLAYQLFRSKDRKALLQANGALQQLVQEHAAKRYQEGYTKGVHDEDATRILQALLHLSEKIDLLCFSPQVRTCAKVLWTVFLEDTQKQLLKHQLSSAGVILKVFPETHGFDFLISDLEKVVGDFLENTLLFEGVEKDKVAQYLFRELSRSNDFIISQEAGAYYQAFIKYLKSIKATKQFDTSVAHLQENRVEQFELIRKWVQAFMEQNPENNALFFIDEIASLLFFEDFAKDRMIDCPSFVEVEALQGSHSAIAEQGYVLDYHAFFRKMDEFQTKVVPQFEAFQNLKKTLIGEYKKALRLDAFKPRVLSSFVRNKLIDQVYLPIFGDNLAKQIGVAGENGRTDRMGMLLLISPPGYGKTTLMEYIADRLGLIFIKINGPTLGHQITSLDPTEAPNLASRQELEKLNLALEMGNNAMLYLDDIQHCDPEFLQKFISLCDAQRKIEGVFKGQSKTYDLRGKRFCVVMAGNPYTEQGDKFQIPDMLANRADIYNLGDIIGDSAEVFKLSYIENALTSNAVLQQLATRSRKDVYTLLNRIETGNKEGLTFEANHSPEEINEYVQVLEKLLVIRDTVLKVNQEYIRSAAIGEDYRTEPAFMLQGSYRDMNKLAEKIVPIMNEDELQTLIFSHYESEAQTLTAAAEANFLKLKELIGALTEEEALRWKTIQRTFEKNKIFRKVDGRDPMAQVLTQLSAFTDGVEGIKEVLGRLIDTKGDLRN